MQLSTGSLLTKLVSTPSAPFIYIYLLTIDKLTHPDRGNLRPRPQATALLRSPNAVTLRSQ